MKFGGLIAAVLMSWSFNSPAQSRDNMMIVGSSTVFPFASAVAEHFGKTTSFPTPIIEATGSGGGMKLFCAGVGLNHPDITNSSRRIKSSEFEKCTENGVTITEVKVGFDGIVIANALNGPVFQLTMKQVFQALAKDVPVNGELMANPYRKWSDIDPALPNTKIEVLGPPPTSGTRDAFVELAMEGGAKQFSMLAALKSQNKKAFKAAAHAIREDGGYVEAGENDNVIVQKLQANPNAIGVFGFSFLEQNADVIKGSEIDGVVPDFESIASGAYGISRSLYFYVKHEHVGAVPGIAEYLVEFTKDGTWGPEGYLVDKGLIPLPDDARDAMRTQTQGLVPLSM